jgi:hypothetical protein
MWISLSELQWGLSKGRTEKVNWNFAEEFLYLVKEITQELGIQENPAKLFNMHKTRLPTNNFPGKKIVVQRGRESSRAVKITNAERGENVRAVGCWCVHSSRGHFRRRKYSRIA